MVRLRSYEPFQRQITRAALIITRLLLFLSVTVGHAGALEVRDSLWGFDGRVVPGAFAPFSVLLENSDDRPFDGTLQLRELRGGGSSAPVMQPVYIGPRSSRWVQFHAFIGSNDAAEFDVSWGRGAKEHKVFDPPKSAGPARVFLRDSDDPF